MKKPYSTNLAILPLLLVVLLFVTACSQSDDNDPDNYPPAADAGPDQQVKTGSLVTLDGSGSSDRDGDLLSYEWTFTSTPAQTTAVLSEPTAVRPTFTADVDGTYLLSLIVHDGKVSSQSGSVSITAETHNSAPVANAGPDQNVATGSLVTLHGGGADADSDLLTFAWALVSRPATSAASLSDPTAARPTFIADVDGTYLLSLTVDDGTVSSQSDYVTITAETHNSAPTANAGPDQNVATGSLVTLHGDGADADGDLLTFAWALVSRPATSTASLSDPTAAQPTFIADVDGTYVLSLTVDDGLVSSQNDYVTITAETHNSAPTAEAGPDQKVTTGSLVSLSGGGADADGDLLTFAWALVTRPATSTATLSDPTAARPTFIADVDGTYLLSLTVHDGLVSSQCDSVTITAIPLSTDLIDYTLMQKRDPESVFTITANRAEFLNSRQKEVAYLYSDYGTGYFNGNFIHEFECRLASISNNAEFMIWMLTNKISDWNSLRFAPIAPGIGVGFYRGVNGITLFQEQSMSDGGRYHPPDIPIQVGVTYYCRVSYDQLTGVMRLQAFMDAARTIPAPGDPARPQLSQTGANEQVLSEAPSYRYLYGVATYTNGADSAITGYVADLKISWLK
ncbi:MAG: hypothetical protein IH614_12785 [Desulfuromonadales bacterium]|nr:hypothetical protein [Desulfuromonadales bacterium]